MAERWFTDDELREMARPTMERAIEATARVAWGVTDEAHSWSYGREGFPLYCTHCAFMNELLPIKWYGLPLYPSKPPQDFDHDPCLWYWYKRAEDIPDEYWQRYGLERAELR